MAQLSIHDDSFVVNEDRSLRPIRLSLPVPPPVEMIDGYNLPIEEQRFRRIKMPEKLKRLQEIVYEKLEAEQSSNRLNKITNYKVIKLFWELLESDQEYYNEEIEFIKKQWWHRLYGYWFMNRGKPTYIDGWHYMYVNYFTMDSETGYPDYRDRDRREFLFYRYCYTTKETFKKLTKKGIPLRNKYGVYEVEEMKRRVCLGYTQNKHRRAGDTSKAINIILEIATRTFGTDGAGIMSYTEDNAKAHFKKKLLPAWNNWPIFFKPFTSSLNNPDSLVLDVPSNEHVNKGLGSSITYAKTAEAKFYDGKKLIAALLDEEGKTENVDVLQRWEVIKNCLSQGNNRIIHGFASHPSTTQEYKSGGLAYRRLCESSNFYKRIPGVGQTQSGLFEVFFSADDGLDDFIDSYGYSVRGKLEDYQIEEGFTQTATEFLMAKRTYLLENNTPENALQYRMEKMQFPLKYDDSWLGEAGEIGFDMNKIDKRIIELERMELRGESPVVRGNFKWRGNAVDTEVIWVQDDEGKFEVSKLFREFSNLRHKEVLYDEVKEEYKEVWMPNYPDNFTAGGDPIDFVMSKTGGVSKGGGAVFWHRDESMDPEEIKSEWQSYKVICTYLYRPRNEEEYNEDMLKMCVWYGAMMYPETNKTGLLQHFINRGYQGYLKHDVDSVTNKLKPKPGVYTMVNSRQQMFRELRDYIYFRCHMENHKEFLKQCKDIRNIKEMTNYDLLTAVGLAITGSKSLHSKILDNVDNSEIDLEGAFFL